MFRQHQITVKQVRCCRDIWGISASSVLFLVFIINGSQTVAFLTETRAINSRISSKFIYSVDLQMKRFCTWTCRRAPDVLCLSYVMKSSVSNQLPGCFWAPYDKKDDGKCAQLHGRGVSRTALGRACEGNWALLHQSF